MSQGVIDIDQVQDVFKGMLASAGAELEPGDLLKVWSVFKEFCRTVKVRTPDDMVFFDIGVFPSDYSLGPEQFFVHFWRQFAHPEEDDNDEPIELDCVFRYEPAEELRRLGGWGRGSDQDASLDDFFASVERHPSLATASRHRTLGVEISQYQM